ncbi:transposase [Thermomicrobiaceae bacterium CFH 74404]|uniref:Transposase n=1 Tax=Thermalbibacter longus TaxID=2951981 RepID=A0AA42B961_9BACT|nr:transposase [Thermalbibacter longus]MCM8747692.1 transposase [Thermalbibacter longus]
MTEERQPEWDWKGYNEHLVQRGEILLNGESLQAWKEERKKMNLGKRGRPFRYPHSLMFLFGTLRVVFRPPYRQLEGLA